MREPIRANLFFRAFFSSLFFSLCLCCVVSSCVVYAVLLDFGNIEIQQMEEKKNVRKKQEEADSPHI